MPCHFIAKYALLSVQSTTRVLSFVCRCAVEMACRLHCTASIYDCTVNDIVSCTIMRRLQSFTALHYLQQFMVLYLTDYSYT
jgi:hypothetical protein